MREWVMRGAYILTFLLCYAQMPDFPRQMIAVAWFCLSFVSFVVAVRKLRG
jgi:hypothetical protein